MEFTLKEVMERGFGEGIETLAECRALPGEAACKVARIWKKIRAEAIAWVKACDAKREELEASFAPEESDGVKQKKRMDLNKQLEEEAGTKTFEVKVSELDFAQLSEAKLSPSMIAALEKVLTNLPE
ncbi:MAG: hypothetical protein HC841_00030 [Verrucomicrobiae bacterium]|nr:hypothetical protein [Verrucomicrobiae bacterium]